MYINVSHTRTNCLVQIKHSKFTIIDRLMDLSLAKSKIEQEQERLLEEMRSKDKLYNKYLTVGATNEKL